MPKTASSCKSSFLGGFILGALLALAAALAVALIISGENPFTSTPEGASQRGQIPGEPKPAPNFDFYQNEPTGDVQTPPAPTPPPVPAAAARYLLQAGAFRDPAEAESLKARLALLGLEARIESGRNSHDEAIQRVRLGPYTNPDDANRTRGLLTQNGIDADLIKLAPEDTP
jgi:cell division protein FtsN